MLCLGAVDHVELGHSGVFEAYLPRRNRLRYGDHTRRLGLS